MLFNFNLKICRTLVYREMKRRKIKTLLLVFSAALVTGMYTFLFLLGNAIEGAYLLKFEYNYGSSSHIIYKGMTEQQTESVKENPAVKSTVVVSEIGTLTDEMIGYRSVTLAPADEAYAKSVSSVPEKGRMPIKPEEIALDEYTMDSLGIPREEGAPVSLQWTDCEGNTQNSDFVLCGWWESSTNFLEACAWITEERAEKLCPGFQNQNAGNRNVGVTLYQTENLEQQAQTILTAQGAEEIGFSVNSAYDKMSRVYARLKSAQYYPSVLLVLLCGFLMFYSILRVSLPQELRTCAELKMLGMTPRQIRKCFFEQAWSITVLGIIPGWMTGFGIHFLVTSRMIEGMEENPALYFLSAGPFILSALCTAITSGLAYFSFSFRINGMLPADAAHREKVVKNRPGKNHAAGKVTLFRLAVRSLKKSWGHMIFIGVSLLLALLILCTAWVQYISYDEDIYLSAYSPWDYILFDGSAQISVQRYNEKNQNLTDLTVEKIKEQDEVTDVSVMKTHEVELTASPELQEHLVEFYNKKTEEGVSRKEMMANQKGWMKGLERLEETGKYTAVVVGTEGAFLDYILHDQPVVQGEFDQKKFLSGKYALTAGATDPEFASLPAGAEVEIAGKNLEIMTVAQTATNFFCGANSPDAEFNLIYCVPLDTFDQMFPGQAYRQAAVNIKNGKEKSFEAFLSHYQERTNSGIGVRSREDYRENFDTARLNEVLAFFIIGVVILTAGLINYGNILLTRATAGRREFAVYESLGMTVGQLKKLLIMQGLLQGGILLLILIPSVFLITWLGFPVWFSQMGSWCMVYHYSLSPLWLTTMVLVLMSVLFPLVGLAVVRKGTVHDRLGIRE